MAWIGAISFYSVFWLLRNVHCDFPTEYLGNYLSDKEYNNRTLCWTPVCMEDSGRLIYAADHDSSKTKPCNDFKTFAMGEFYKHRVPNDRYAYVGYSLNAAQQYFERQRRMMLKPIKKSDPKIFKVMKSLFRQCINSSKAFCWFVNHMIWNLFFRSNRKSRIKGRHCICA